MKRTALWAAIYSRFFGVCGKLFRLIFFSFDWRQGCLQPQISTIEVSHPRLKVACLSAFLGVEAEQTPLTKFWRGGPAKRIELAD